MATRKPFSELRDSKNAVRITNRVQHQYAFTHGLTPTRIKLVTFHVRGKSRRTIKTNQESKFGLVCRQLEKVSVYIGLGIGQRTCGIINWSIQTEFRSLVSISISVSVEYVGWKFTLGEQLVKWPRDCRLLSPTAANNSFIFRSLFFQIGRNWDTVVFFWRTTLLGSPFSAQDLFLQFSKKLFWDITSPM